MECYYLSSDYFEQSAVENSFSGSQSWVILSSVEQSIKRKIEAIGTPLKEWDVRINYGIKTGLNDAFIISGEKKDELIAADPKSAEIIRPILRGRDIRRYGFDFSDQWVIVAKFGSHEYLGTQYPAIYKHLLEYEAPLKNRGQCRYTSSRKENTTKEYPGQHHWLELDNNPCQEYLDDFSRQKIVWKRVGSQIRFALDNSGLFCLDSTCFLVGKNLEFLTLLLNSTMGKFLLKDSPKTGTGDLLISVQAIEPLLIPKISEKLDSQFKNYYNTFISNTNNTDIENEINQALYNLYSLSPDEISFVDNLVL